MTRGSRRRVGYPHDMVRPARCLLIVTLLAGVLAAQGATWVASTTGAGEQSDAGAIAPRVSDNGRWLVFASLGGNLSGLPGTWQVYLKDALTGSVDLISVTQTGLPTAVGCTGSRGAPSAAGRFIAFDCAAPDLVPSDTNLVRDVFVRDRILTTTRRISITNNGVEADGASRLDDISDNARFVVFTTRATNLSPGEIGVFDDVYLHDRWIGTTSRVSSTPTGRSGNDTSADGRASASGRFIVFWSRASDLVPNDTNGVADVFRFDRSTGQLEIVSVDPNGVQADLPSSAPTISAEGRHVVFSTLATNLGTGAPNGNSQLVRKDMVSGAVSLITVSRFGAPSNGPTPGPASISVDGRHVAFWSLASDLTVDDPDIASDVFIRDLAAARTILVSQSSTGLKGTPACINPALPCKVPLPVSLSGDARIVAFEHSGDLLVPGGDGNGIATDILVNDWSRTTRPIGPAQIGQYATLQLRGSLDPGASYLAGLALGPGPGPLVGARRVPLADDSLLQWSLRPGNPALLGFNGTLDVMGEATASVQIPNVISLVGMDVWAAFIVHDAWSLVRGASNAVRITIAP
ncbi:MAG: hypothetical protein CMJ83_15280 [Planctomycetes bacterium]|nr:hypothetical protein [Planctomycetota bacterium]